METIRPLVELTKFREKIGVTRKVFAMIVMYPPTTEATVSRWESGHRRPGRKYLKQLSCMTGLSLADLLGLE